MSVADTLRAARAKIEQPEAWTKGRLAVNKRTGNSVHPKHRLATCWCAEGAIVAVEKSQADYISALAAMERALPPFVRLVNWNDNGFRTHAEVLALFDVAIEKSEASEK